MEKDFESLYNEINESCNNNEELKKELEKYRKRKIKILFVALIIIAILDIVMYAKFKVMIFGIIVMDIILFCITYALMNYKNKINIMFKRIAITKLMENFFCDVNYNPIEALPRVIYDEPNYPGYYNRYKSDDYLTCKLDKKYKAEMAEVYVADEETHRDANGNTTTTTKVLFHGLFMKINLGKSIQTTLKIAPDKTFFLKAHTKLDSAEFEKYFDVSAENKMIGMQILTADVMELLVEFAQSIKCKFDIYIINNYMYIRLNTRKDMFEAKKIGKEIINKKELEYNYNMLKFISNLSKKVAGIIDKTQI